MDVTFPLPESASSARDPADDIDTKGLWMLSALHFSSTWGARCAEFGWYLMLSELFSNTLLVASIFGFFTTGIAVLISGIVGSFVDKYHRLVFIRCAIAIQKLSEAIGYGLFLCFFLIPSLSNEAGQGSQAQGSIWAAFAALTTCGMVLRLATIAVTISIEQDWVSTIGGGKNRKLMQLNVWLRRIDLVGKLVAPLFVAGLTAGVSYPFTAALLCGMSVVTLAFEIVLCGIVYRCFPELDRERREPLERVVSDENPTPRRTWRALVDFRALSNDLMEFSRMPVFFTSLAISSVYLTVLSFDGTFLTYIKTAGMWDDRFIAGMRGLCTVTGLLGTVLLPIVERKIGLIRAGSWGIWTEILFLIPVVLSLNIGVSPDTYSREPLWNSVLLFGGMAASRTSLWMFDLAQLQILQEALEGHPRRNSLAALQYTMQNTFDLLKYTMTIVLSNPRQFRWAALASWGSVLCGGTIFLVYVRRTRGHIIHREWLTKFLLWKKEA